LRESGAWDNPPVLVVTNHEHRTAYLVYRLYPQIG
jgi:hypothetical protein